MNSNFLGVFSGKRFNSEFFELNQQKLTHYIPLARRFCCFSKTMSMPKKKQKNLRKKVKWKMIATKCFEVDSRTSEDILEMNDTRVDGVFVGVVYSLMKSFALSQMNTGPKSRSFFHLLQSFGKGRNAVSQWKQCLGLSLGVTLDCQTNLKKNKRRTERKDGHLLGGIEVSDNFLLLKFWQN